MTNLSELRTASANADATFFAAREAYQATIDACATDYSDAAWLALTNAEFDCCTAKKAMERANELLEGAELISVGVRK